MVPCKPPVIPKGLEASVAVMSFVDDSLGTHGFDCDGAVRDRGLRDAGKLIQMYLCGAMTPKSKVAGECDLAVGTYEPLCGIGHHPDFRCSLVDFVPVDIGPLILLDAIFGVVGIQILSTLCGTMLDAAGFGVHCEASSSNGTGNLKVLCSHVEVTTDGLVEAEVGAERSPAYSRLAAVTASTISPIDVRGFQSWKLPPVVIISVGGWNGNGERRVTVGS